MSPLNKGKYAPSEEEVKTLYEKLNAEAEQSGYHLNPDREFVFMLMQGLLVNQERYGYLSCPCRLASGKIEEDRDMICPCDYRDPDLDEYGACYCALYVSEDKLRIGEEVYSVPERRPSPEERLAASGNPKQADAAEAARNLSYPVWRCKVCGYLAARDNPPEVCPICKAKKDRFERFM
ncbi:MAG: ferredoxin-thioredoxin reductase catalytic domain-containing protein [Thermovirga sp.]